VGIAASDGGIVSDAGTGISVEEIASGVGEEQEAMKRKMKEERSTRVAIDLCMKGF